jgi:transposase
VRSFALARRQKDVPLGIRPVYVREQEQVIGLTRLLTIALRLLTLFELTVRAAWATTGEELTGLYEGQPSRKTSRPTGTRMLKAIARMGVTLTRVMAGADSRWYVSALPALLARILELAGLSLALYTGLAPNTGQSLNPSAKEQNLRHYTSTWAAESGCQGCV